MGQEEPGVMQLDHLWQGSCSWGRKGVVVVGDGENSSS